MATSTSKRKPGTSRAASSTSTSTRTSDADVVEQPDTPPAPVSGAAAPSPASNPDQTSPIPTVNDPTTVDDDGQAATEDPAAALKRRVKTTQMIGDVRPDELTEEQRLNLAGPPVGAVGGPRTLTSMSQPVNGKDYTTAPTDGYIAFVPKNIRQPATKRVWVEGQPVRKDMLEALSGLVAPTASEARVLTGEEYEQAANYL